MKLDLHNHTWHSPDSLNDLKGLMSRAKKLGIIPAITDHNSVSAHAELRKMGATFIPGEEIRADAGDLIGLYINELIPRKTGFVEAMDLGREQGGDVYLPHMYDARRRGVSDRKLAGKADIIEVLNGHCTNENNALALEFAQKNRKLFGAGSDAHLLNEFGKCYVETAEFDISEPKEFLKALKKGKIRGKAEPALKGLHAAVKIGKKLFRL